MLQELPCIVIVVVIVLDVFESEALVQLVHGWINQLQATLHIYSNSFSGNLFHKLKQMTI